MTLVGRVGQPAGMGCVTGFDLVGNVGGAGVVTMWGVPQRLRPLAASLGTITLHMLGDVPAPPLVGWLQGTPSPLGPGPRNTFP